jgi:hypothetical protein
MRDPSLLPGPGRGGGHQVRFPKLKGGCYGTVSVHSQTTYGQTTYVFVAFLHTVSFVELKNLASKKNIAVL